MKLAVLSVWEFINKEPADFVHGGRKKEIGDMYVWSRKENWQVCEIWFDQKNEESVAGCEIFGHGFAVCSSCDLRQ
jgi:hypothetical protein